MEYLHVLSRPKVIDQEHDVIWTEAYIDSTVSLQEALCLFAEHWVEFGEGPVLHLTQLENAQSLHSLECELCM